MVSRTNKFRGRNRTHGRGHKAGRGAGKRGGRGTAGMNKHRVMTRIKYMPGHWGMHGFNRPPELRTVHETLNVGDLDALASDGSVDLGAHGIDKLLGSGRIENAVSVTVAHASQRAIEKVEAAGGTVELAESDGWDEEWDEDEEA